MGIGIGTALLISTAATGVASHKQKTAQEEAQDEADKLAEQAKKDEQAMLLESSKSEQVATFDYGVDNEMGSYNDFITPTDSKTKAPSASLGFTNGSNSQLGF